ncbi:DUF6241 domain-containing protein [Peribacillus butanolivorans]|uniref:DUF6241 domain-containing protein n=1 Tax=Peribacillus butanolivorans TaxID=421767 RepID=UPI002E23789B|nr:DUF6241 domain-containing protein [Peribacillus butanolivorans]
MKKKIMYGTLGAALLAFGTYAYLSYNSPIAEAQDEPNGKIVADAENTQTAEVDYKLSSEELQKAQKEIGKVNNEEDVIFRMIVMTLQKVNFGGESEAPRGVDPNSFIRAQMTKGNIQYLKNQLDSIEISRLTKTDGYEKMLDKWAEGNFDQVDKDAESLVSFLSEPYGKYEGDKLGKKGFLQEENYVKKMFGENSLKFQQ